METFYFISPKSTSQPIRSTKTVILTGVFTAKLPLIVLPLIHRALHWWSSITAITKVILVQKINNVMAKVCKCKLEKET